MNNNEQAIKNRISLLSTRKEDNGSIIKKLERKLRQIQKKRDNQND